MAVATSEEQGVSKGSMSVGLRRATGWLNVVISAALALLVWGLAVIFAAKPSLKVLWDGPRVLP